MTWYLDTAATGAAVGLVSGWWVPALIARIPEPAPEPRPEQAAGVASAGSETDPGLMAGAGEGTEEPKEPYVAIAATRGLRVRSALATGLVAALLGGRVGWGPELSFLWYLAFVGVALAVVDWRTRLLPTRVIAPSYVVVALLAVASALVSGDLDALATAGWGWLVAGGSFFVLWFVYPRGMGYGDVRLSGVLGIALGYLGWAELVTGIYAGFLVGAVGGLALAGLRIVDRKAYPFGPFMLVGAVIGVLSGPVVAAWYG
ncbi:MAG: prepilin peptidase [Nocardioidaceae bacterium]